MKMIDLEVIEGIDGFDSCWELRANGKIVHIASSQPCSPDESRKHPADSDKHTFSLESHEVNYGGPESFFNTLLDDVNLLGHNATLPSKDAWKRFSIDLLEERPGFTILFQISAVNLTMENPGFLYAI